MSRNTDGAGNPLARVYSRDRSTRTLQRLRPGRTAHLLPEQALATGAWRNPSAFARIANGVEMGLALVGLCYKGTMKKLLITGGAGFIGSHLVDRLLATDVEHITVVDDFNDFYDPSIKRANIREHLKDPRYNISRELTFEIARHSNKYSKATTFDCVVHLAARAGVRPSLSEPQLYTETNVNGTLNLLELARHSNIKQFVFGSSSSVYGINAKVPFSEDDPIRQPISPYAATKGAGELLCHTYSHLYGLRCVCLRFFHGLWTTPTPGSRDSQIRQADNASVNQSRFSATALRVAITPTSTT